MKRTLAALALAATLLLQISPAYASCTYTTYFVNGRFMQCTTCCYGSTCTTTCF